MERRHGRVLWGVAWLCVVAAAVTAGNVFMGSAGASDLNDLERISPFGARSLWLMRQARAIIETYQVDAASKPAPEDKLHRLVPCYTSVLRTRELDKVFKRR